MKVNFDSIKSPASGPNSGWYECHVEKVEEFVTTTKRPAWKILFAVMGPEFENWHFYDNIVFVETALWKLKALFKSCRIEISGEVDIVPSQLQDKFVSVRVRRKINGEMPIWDVVGYRPAGSGVPIENDSEAGREHSHG